MRAAVLLGVLMAGPASADGTIIVSPIYSQLVAAAVPEGFKASYEAEKDGSYLLELIPDGESVEAWTQMITVTGARGLAETATVEDFAGYLADGYQSACPDSFAAQQLPSPEVRGAVKVFAGYLGCGDLGGRSEAMVFLVIQGKSELYSVQFAERAAQVSGPPQPDPGIWQSRVDLFGLTRVCDDVGEAAPYPACTE